MNKKVLIAAALLTTVGSFAQDAANNNEGEAPKNKYGQAVLPKAGDIGLGFNAVPFIDMAFNAGKINSGGFNNVGGNLNQYVVGATNQIVGKYYLSDKAAIRGRIGINTVSGSITNRVQDSKAIYDASMGNTQEQTQAAVLTLEDKYKFNKQQWLLSAGYEMRRGYRRLQGYYGGEIAFGGQANKEYFTYANDYSDLYATHYTNFTNANFVGQVQHNPFQQGRQERALYNNYRGGFRFGMRGFIGVEYFVFAKISVGAEFGWGWAYTSRTNRITTVEVYDNTNGLAEVYNEERSTDSNEKTKGFSVDNGSNNGNFNSTSNFGGAMNNFTGGNGNGFGNTGLAGGTGAINIIFHF